MPGFKDALLHLANHLGLPAEAFDAVGIHAWPAVFRKMEAAFVIHTPSTHFNWWGERLKGPQCRLVVEKGHAHAHLDQLVDARETVWFVACDRGREPSKYWLFQGQVPAIQAVLRAGPSFAYYLVSKKYEWLLGATDPDVLVSLKSVIPKMEGLRQITTAQ